MCCQTMTVINNTSVDFIFRIGAHAFSLLENENIYPSGLILEAPFNKMSEAIREYSTTMVIHSYDNTLKRIERRKVRSDNVSHLIMYLFFVFLLLFVF